MNRQPPHQPNDTLAGRYTILGAGSPGPFGFVFKAKDNELGLTVALKVLRADLFADAAEHEEFLKALKLGRRLSHVHLSRVTAEGEEEGRPYFTSAWLEGETLRARLSARRAEGKFHSLEEVEPLMHKLCAAIEAAHVHGPHSDLKPENIFFTGDSLKVTDFGLGRMPKTSFWSGQKEAGAEAYLAPERESGAGANRAGDIYALGVILGELLWGISPDKGRPSPFPFQPAHAEEVEALYLRAMAAEPADRFSTPRELYEALLAAVSKQREVRASPPVELDEGSMKTELMTQVMSFPDVPPVAARDDEEVPTQQGVHIPRAAREASEPAAKSPPPAGPSPSALAQDASPTTALSWSQVQQAPSSKSASGKDALMWLIVLVLLGILVGTLGGLWVLGRMRKVEPLTKARVEAATVAPAAREQAVNGLSVLRGLELKHSGGRDE
jgi:serine/threonine protein kinase